LSFDLNELRVMRAPSKVLMILAATAAMPSVIAHAQVQLAPPVAVKTVGQASPTPAAQAPAVDPLAAQPAGPPLPPPPPPFWSLADVQELIAYIGAVGREGLDPNDYDAPTLVAAMRGGDPARLSELATLSFNKLSNDLALGHVRRGDRDGWFIKDNDLDATRQDALLRYALSRHGLTDALNGLLPTHPQYQNLKDSLAGTTAAETDKINRLRLNMERWRWLPRELGEKYIIVNVPSFQVALVENGQTTWREPAVAGALTTPTPMLSVMATGVSLNPWWEVPPSISKEVAGKPGYVALKDPKTGKIQRWRQPPGPSNALGELKFVMYNPQNIYLHDTNARSRFDSRMRSLSHGCIRTKNVVGLAKTLFAEEGNQKWTAEKIDEVLASKKNVQADFDKPIPVYIVYFSSAARTDGGLVNYEDVYRRDAKVLAALNDALPAKAAKPKTEVASK
jgi:murein L,D-transpeptidase YcbB/YkuD